MGLKGKKYNLIPMHHSANVQAPSNALDFLVKGFIPNKKYTFFCVF